MKVTLNWLKQYATFVWTPEELSERLTMMGIEVEGIQKLSGEFEGVVVAQILASDKHPNADKLSVCKVADGRGERQIVCGAKNYKVGDKVPLALPGCTLPTSAGAAPFTIKVSKMRGVESQGMLCSAKELGLAEDAEGLLILPAEAKVGQNLAEHLGRPAGDVVFDLEVTPNRPDLNSVVGIAREICAVTGEPLKLPVIQFLNTSSEPIAGVVNVRVEDPKLCPRYNARVVRGIKVGPSPDWLRQTLEKVGVRSINNIVDITNFVLYEIGQPLHAFDYHLLAAAGTGSVPTIVVRHASDGEKFTTLDGVERTLAADALLIADETKAVALAGIMGGRNSEIHETTVDVLIESACFQPQNIRATSKKLELRTDASYRFERGCDIGICDWASRRAAQLMSEIAGGVILGHNVDAYPHPAAQKEILLRPARSNLLLGIAIPRPEQVAFLQKLGLEILDEQVNTDQNDVPIRVRIPTFRVDLKSEIDLVEEIARLFGINRIPATAPRGAIGAHPFDSVYDQLMGVRRNLASAGLFEAQGQTLISDGYLERPPEIGPQTVWLENPLSSDMNVLRPSLVPGLLDALRHNLHHKNQRVPLFEIGRVFFENQGQVAEERRLAIALTGNRLPSYWSGSDREASFDLYDLKGILEELFENLGLRGISFARRGETKALLLESASINLGKQSVGEIGLVLPTLSRKLDLRDPVFVAEVNIDFLLARSSNAKAFKPLPSLPSVRRDIAMLVPEQISHEAVIAAVKQTKPQNLEAIELFDVFRGKNIPAGQKSVAYAFTYRGADRTLTDAEVNTAHEKVIAQLKQALQAVVR
jgi:phenylalanyl-tRNA synthetase beta chain